MTPPKNHPAPWVMITLAVALALLFTTVILVAMGASPIEAYVNMLKGAFGSINKWADVLVAWVPLVLCAVGLSYTFAAGLWNIGIEGQMIMGAIAATWAARSLDLPSFILIPLIFLSGMAGGALWACLTGFLRIYGRVHEIFAGLGLNFVAVGATNFLIFGPWKQPGTATMSGTEFFRPTALLPDLFNLSLGPVEIILAGLAILGSVFALRGTMWGLKLKAVGNNPSASFFLGLKVDRNILLAFGWAGALAGAAGATQAIGLYHRLVPSISSGYGYLAILVVLLTGNQTLWIAPVAFFFAAANKGSLQLPMVMHLDSALGGVLQEALVLFVILARGIQSRIWRKKT
jgi:general nucleoside transport system permease protein